MTVPNSVSLRQYGPSYEQLVDLYLAQGTITAKIAAIYYEKSFHQSTANIPENATFGVLLDRTNFYAEAGGQEYDTGRIDIIGEDDVQDAKFEVTNVQSYSSYVLHIGQLEYGQLSTGAEVTAAYDKVSRIFTASYSKFHSLIIIGKTITS